MEPLNFEMSQRISMEKCLEKHGVIHDRSTI